MKMFEWVISVSARSEEEHTVVSSARIGIAPMILRLRLGVEVHERIPADEHVHA
jgi:hypothetical protein